MRNSEFMAALPKFCLIVLFASTASGLPTHVLAQGKDAMTKNKAISTMISIVPLKDASGIIRANAYIQGERIVIRDMAGRTLTMDSASTKSFAPIDPMRMPDTKADSVDQKGIGALQSQIDSLVNKMNELTRRLNEVTN